MTTPGSKICPICGATFHRREREKADTWRLRKYCSIPCANAGRAKSNRKSDSLPPDKVCPVCGCRFSRNGREAWRWAKMRYCSCSCARQRAPAPNRGPKTQNRSGYCDCYPNARIDSPECFDYQVQGKLACPNCRQRSREGQAALFVPGHDLGWSRLGAEI